MNVAQKQFLGYGKVASDIYKASDIPELCEIESIVGSTQPCFVCKIEWMSKYPALTRQPVGFETVKYIRNSHNNNNSINM